MFFGIHDNGSAYSRYEDHSYIHNTEQQHANLRDNSYMPLKLYFFLCDPECRV